MVFAMNNAKYSSLSPDLKKVRDAADKTIVDSPVLMEGMGKLSESINNLAGKRSFNSTSAIGLAVILVLFGAFVALLIYESHSRQWTWQQSISMFLIGSFIPFGSFYVDNRWLSKI